MNNEFEQDMDWELEDEMDDPTEFDEFDDELGPIAVRTAIMQKNNMIALLGIRTAPAGAAICRVDPRDDHPAMQVYDDALAAVEWFSKSLQTSKRNGWNVIYDGVPLEG